jgi:hypothetical protein
MNKIVTNFLLRVVLPTAVGGIIYYFCRRHNIVFFSWLDKGGFCNVIDDGPIIVLPRNLVVHLFIYSLPDGLWLFAFANAMQLIWREKRFSIIILASLGVFSVGHELGQAFGFVSGTFDIIDVAMYLFALGFSLIINTYNGGKHNVEELKSH